MPQQPCVGCCHGPESDPPRNRCRALDDGGLNPEQFWHSPDPVSWDLVRETQLDQSIAAVGAGPEGFVAVDQWGWQTNNHRAFVVASSDGKSWIEAPAADGALAAVGSLWTIVPLDGYWLTAPPTVDDELPVLWSAGGHCSAA